MSYYELTISIKAVILIFYPALIYFSVFPNRERTN